MTITQNVASKLVVSLVAVSMLFSFSFSPAKAATAEELQAQITALLAQIGTLQGQLGQGSSSAGGVCPFTWTRDLTLGASGDDVMKLQSWMIANGASIPAGATGYFGAQTQSALASWQSANAITPAAGYFGPITRAKVNGMCVSAPAGDDDANDDDANDDDANDDANDDGPLSGEASLDNMDAKAGDDTDLEEGQEDAPVADFDIEFTDGDAQITRVDVSLVGSGDEQDPWDTFEEVSLWVDGEEVARMDASDEDEYLDEDDGSLRFSGLDIVGREDEEITVTVGVTVQSSVDGSDDGEAWEVAMEAMRFVDGDDVSTTEDSGNDFGTGVDFDIEEEGGSDELQVGSSDNDPDGSTLELQDDERSDWLTVFIFELDADDSENDITVNDLPVALTVSSSTAATYINDVQLVIDGETYDDVTVTDSTAAGYYVFDTDGDLVIAAGDAVEVEVQVEFNQLDLGSEGVTVQGSASSTNIDAEGADDLSGNQLSGSATGETHTLRTTGVTVDMTDSSFESNNNSDTPSESYGEFTVEVEVTAVGDDVYVAETAVRGTTANSSYGATFQVEDANGNSTTTGSVTSSFQRVSGGTLQNSGRYKISEGSSATFELTVTYDPALINGEGQFQVQFVSFGFNDTDAAPDTAQTATPAGDFESDQGFIDN